MTDDSVNDNYADLFAYVAEMYSHSIIGGPLHIVLDDGNVDDESIQFCRESYSKCSEGDVGNGMAVLVECVSQRLLSIDEGTREKLYEMRWTNSGSQDHEAR